jgi:hypothetical protein
MEVEEPGWNTSPNDSAYVDDMDLEVTIPPDPPPHRCIRAVTTQRNNIPRSNISQVKLKGDTFCELDSHADTCSFGPGAYIVRDTNQTISVAGFLETLGTAKD